MSFVLELGIVTGVFAVLLGVEFELILFVLEVGIVLDTFAVLP